MTARRMAVAAVLSLLAAVVVYGWGAEHMFAIDIAQRCGYPASYELPPQYGHARFFPLSLKCAAGRDLVPSYVTPQLN